MYTFNYYLHLIQHIYGDPWGFHAIKMYGSDKYSYKLIANITCLMIRNLQIYNISTCI